MSRRLGFAWLGLAPWLVAGAFALTRPSRLWASLFYSSALLALTAALVAIPLRRGRGRASWAGFVACGGTYLVLTTCPILDTHVGVHLLPSAGLDLLYPKIAHRPPSAGPFSYSAWEDWASTDLNFARRYVGSAVLVSSESYMRIGHSVVAVIVGLIGAGLGKALAREPVAPNLDGRGGRSPAS